MLGGVNRKNPGLLAEIREKSCVVCARIPCDPHHLKTVGAHGQIDEDWNVVPLCRQCHSKVHSTGIYTFARAHESFFNWLIDRGWLFNELNGKLYHPKVRDEFDS